MSSHGCCTLASLRLSSSLIWFPLVLSERESTAIGHFSLRYGTVSSALFLYIQSPFLANFSRLCVTSQCLADCIGLSCTLVRGEYNRAWNEVLLFDGSPSRNKHSSQPCCYIVDLMHQPGNLLRAKSPAAEQYQTI